jgi:hypothetical protein
LFRFSPDVRLHVHEVPELQEALVARSAPETAEISKKSQQIVESV